MFYGVYNCSSENECKIWFQFLIWRQWSIHKQEMSSQSIKRAHFLCFQDVYGAIMYLSDYNDLIVEVGPITVVYGVSC